MTSSLIHHLSSEARERLGKAVDALQVVTAANRDDAYFRTFHKNMRDFDSLEKSEVLTESRAARAVRLGARTLRALARLTRQLEQLQRRSERDEEDQAALERERRALAEQMRTWAGGLV